jgi:uncharacterized protein
MQTKFKVLAAMLALVSVPAGAADHFPVFQGHPVMDAANIIPADREAELNAKIVAYEDRTKNEIALVTVASLEDNDIEGYANRMFRHYGIGRNDADNGVLFRRRRSPHQR